jgi:tripartite-type tricarboxylate transporter receptor subunit TctC
MNRRDIIKVCGGVVVSWPIRARAQSYPSRTVRIVVGYPAGGTTDFVARLIARWLSERFGVSFIVENRPGAGTNIATEGVVRASGDGYTLLLVTPANAINDSFYRDLPFNFVRDIAPVAGLIRSPYVLVTIPAIPAKSVPELISYAKGNPSKLNMASFGTGTGSHLCAEMFKMMTGVEINHVPYRGSAPMLTDLLGGQVQAAFDNLPASIEYIKSGKLHALAVTTERRTEALPDVPALGEFLTGYEASSWLAVGAPKSTPPEIIDSLNREIVAGLADTGMRAQLQGQGASPLGGSPAATAALIAEETEKWAKVVRFSGAKPN